MFKEQTQEKLDFLGVIPKLEPHVSYNTIPLVQF